ncbi:MAG: lactate utilization protein [Oscillospiraceae bacterium]|nr:lactate utilization protein [Oscillospiraceae bacterium]
MDDKIIRTMDALSRNKMKPYYAESREELYELIRELIKDDKLITAGGSMSLKESGVSELLMSEYKGIYLDRSEGKTPDEVNDIFRKAFVSDTFFSSTNALTEEGELYNIDGNGNRVSAMIFGPKQVIVVAGVNKIVKDRDEAKRRVEEYAAPKNAARLNCQTPCAKTGKCERLRSGKPCESPARICCSYVILGQQRVPDRIKVIIVNQELGY